eukprot:TRINITY_DN2743_c0_g1_i1.p1 TRINITY_DN2743_c0_g1~~TRINITY_DN2743_c0_g1_i1.p1  ORF type:complete len:131 (+),score=15.24 TRINITY_DN2743_c0_g1_i1:145-537(+)
MPILAPSGKPSANSRRACLTRQSRPLKIGWTGFSELHLAMNPTPHQPGREGEEKYEIAVEKYRKTAKYRKYEAAKQAFKEEQSSKRKRLESKDEPRSAKKAKAPKRSKSRSKARSASKPKAPKKSKSRLV